MLKNIYHSIYSFKTVVNVLMALLIYIILKVFGIIELKGSFALLYEIGNIFIIWTLFECLLKKDYFYIMFLYLMALPLQNWLIIRTHNVFDIIISPFLINYSFVFLFVFLVKIIFNQRKIKKVKFQVLFPFWCIMLFSIISIINSKNVFIAINGITYGLIIPFMVFLIIINILKDKKDIILICEAIVLSLLFYNILNFVLEYTELLSVSFGSGRVSGIFSNPFFYAPLLMVSSLLSIYLIYYYKTTQVISKTLYFSAFCLSMFLLLMTGRGGILGFFVALWVFFYQIFRLNKKYLLLSIFITVLISITFYIDIFKFLQASELMAISSFLSKGLETERLNIWLLSYDFILAKELFFSGIGMGVLMHEEIGWTTPHNSFLYLSATIGVMGSILYHYILISSINIKSLLTQNINKNIPGIIVLSSFIYMNINGYRILLFRYTDPYLTHLSLNVHINVIYLWIFVGVSYFASNSRLLFKG